MHGHDPAARCHSLQQLVHVITLDMSLLYEKNEFRLILFRGEVLHDQLDHGLAEDRNQGFGQLVARFLKAAAGSGHRNDELNHRFLHIFLPCNNQ